MTSLGSKINILVVEDSEEKMNLIRDVLIGLDWSNFGVEPFIASADCCTAAITLYEREFWEIVILDLAIPFFPNGPSDVENSKGFYEHMRKARRETPFFVLGLTSVVEETVIKTFPLGANFSIVRFDSAGHWAEIINDRLLFLSGAKAGLSQHLMKTFRHDVLIVTARKINEYDPIVAQIKWVGNYSYSMPEMNGKYNLFGQWQLGGNSFRLGIVCLDEMGLSHSSAVVTDLIHLLRPKYVAMLGMCCGLRKNAKGEETVKELSSKLGDIIIASSTSCWDEGKYDDADVELRDSMFFNNRAVVKMPEAEFWKRVERAFESSHTEIATKVKKYYRSLDLELIEKDLKGEIKFNPKATIMWNQMISGPCVVNSGALIDKIEKRFSQALGLEMEAHSVYSAVECVSGAKPKVLVIKGVADFGDGTKAKVLQPYASAASFIVFEGILKALEENH